MIKKFAIGTLLLVTPMLVDYNQADASENTQVPQLSQVKNVSFDLSNPSEQIQVIQNKDGSQTTLTMSAVESEMQTPFSSNYDSLPVGVSSRHIKAASWTVTFEFDVKYNITKDMSKSYIMSIYNTEYRSMIGTLSDIQAHKTSKVAELSGTYTVLNAFSSQKVWLKTQIFRNSLNTTTNIS